MAKATRRTKLRINEFITSLMQTGRNPRREGSPGLDRRTKDRQTDQNKTSLIHKSTQSLWNKQINKKILESSESCDLGQLSSSAFFTGSRQTDDGSIVDYSWHSKLSKYWPSHISCSSWHGLAVSPRLCLPLSHQETMVITIVIIIIIIV